MLNKKLGAPLVRLSRLMSAAALALGMVSAHAANIVVLQFESSRLQPPSDLVAVLQAMGHTATVLTVNDNSTPPSYDVPDIPPGTDQVWVYGGLMDASPPYSLQQSGRLRKRTCKPAWQPTSRPVVPC